MGLWDRLSGKRGKVSELNARDTAAGRSRDRAEKQNLIETQMQERGELQGRVMQMREQHRRDRQDHRAELGAMLSMSKDSVRDRFMEHGQELDARKANPPTAAQTRRDRAEKMGTMPEIVASERTRRADARADREARKTGVEGQEAGTGETAPETEQAPTAQPEATQQHGSGQGQESTPHGRRNNVRRGSTPSATVRRRSSVTGGAMTMTPGARWNPEPGSEKPLSRDSRFAGELHHDLRFRDRRGR
jgi:hypothetical protein